MKIYKLRYKMIFKKYKNIVLLLLLLMCSTAIIQAKSIVKWKSIPVVKFWSRRAVQFDTKSKIFFYRPNRFEKMMIDVSAYQEIQLKVISKEKNEMVKFSVNINGNNQEYNLKKMKNNEHYYFYEPLTLQIPKDCKNFSVYTRNPNLYFRAFGKEVKIIKSIPASLVMKAEQYKRIVTLISSKTRSEYYVADASKSLKMSAKYNGTASVFLRFLPLANKSRCKVEIYVNQKLMNVQEYPHKLSGEYRVNDQKVSVGKKVNIPNLKKNDQIEIRVVSAHEILVRSILKTGK